MLMLAFLPCGLSELRLVMNQSHVNSVKGSEQLVSYRQNNHDNTSWLDLSEPDQSGHGQIRVSRPVRFTETWFQSFHCHSDVTGVKVRVM